MRPKTVVILGIVVVGGVLFILPAIVEAVFLPSLRQGIPDPVPDYEQILLGIAFFLHRYRWLLTPPALIALFLLTAFGKRSAARS